MGKGGRDTNLEVEIRFAVVGSIGKRKKFNLEFSSLLGRDDGCGESKSSMMMIQGKRAIAFRTGKLEMKTTNDAVSSYVFFSVYDGWEMTSALCHYFGYVRFCNPCLFAPKKKTKIL